MSEHKQRDEMATWTHNLVDAIADQSSGRSAIHGSGDREVMHRLVGFDGTYDGGLRPFPGMKQLVDLRDTLNDDAHWEDPATAPGDFEVLTMRPVNFRIGDTKYGYGFVVQVESPGEQQENYLFIVYRIGSDTGWNVKQLHTQTARPTWSVQSVGRLVYVFVKGLNPILFFVEEDETKNVVGGSIAADFTGPGPVPVAANATFTDMTAAETGKIFAEAVTTTTGYDTGLHSDVNDIKIQKPDDYKIAVQFSNSTTGRRSPLSEIAVIDTDDFSAVDRYFKLLISYDDDLWDTVMVYRSIGVTEGGAEYGGAYLHLDRVIDVADATTSDNSTNGKRFTYFLELEDMALVLQDVWQDFYQFDEKMPPGGASFLYDQGLLVSDIEPVSGDPTTYVDSLGEIRYSSFVEASYELFPPNNRIVPKTPAHRVIRFEQAGENVIGFAKSTLIHFHKEGFFLRAAEIHPGLGIVNERACETVASQTYYVTPRGLKVVSPNGDLEDVKVINEVIINRWRGNLGAVSVAYDALLGAIFIHNSAEEETEVIWLNTQRAMSLEDMTFDLAVRGMWPEDLDDTTSDLVERAFFLRMPGTANNPALVYVTDAERTKTSQTLMDIDGTAVTASVTAATTTTITVGSALSSVLVGAYLYVLDVADSADKDRIGERFKISSVSASPDVVTLPANHGIQVGDRVGYTPVPCRVVGPPVPLFVEGMFGGTTYNPFRNRRINHVGCSFVNVSGSSSGQTYAKFVGEVYLGNSYTPEASSVPVSGDGSTSVISVEDGTSRNDAAFRNPQTNALTRGNYGLEGATIGAGIKIVVPDLDFTLLGISVTGKITESTRTEKPR